jgi:hypothetical protein
MSTVLKLVLAKANATTAVAGPDYGSAHIAIDEDGGAKLRGSFPELPTATNCVVTEGRFGFSTNGFKSRHSHRPPR